jgi:hypothetical protein
MFKAQPSFWHMLLPALGLHGLLLAYPIETKGDLEAALPKPGKPVRVITLPSASPLSNITKPTVRQRLNPPSKPQSASVLQLKRAAPPKIVAPPKTVIPVTKPKPLASQPPSPKPTPSGMPTPPVTPSSEFQMEGATAGCTGGTTQDCFALTDSDGRSVASQIEKNLENKGYDLSPLELAEENGMKVYQLSKRGQPKQGQPEDYLHVFWDENGTVYFRNPTVLSYKELALKARQ